MILFKENTAGVKGEQIKEWVVWFRTPFGFTNSLEIAIKKCEGVDLDPNICIRPFVVAITENDYEIVL